MEPLKVIYDGYEIEIRSGGISMPIITIKKMPTNTIAKEEEVVKLPSVIQWPQGAPSWWENPPMWWNNKPYCEGSFTANWTNQNAIYPDHLTTHKKTE